MTEDIDKSILEDAIKTTIPRFPSIAARLRRGLFWYYLEELDSPPEIMDEDAYPLRRMSGKEMRRAALRFIVYKNRLAVEFFHALTDGNGGLIFLKTLTAEYAERCYGISVPCTDGILNRNDSPKEEELVDDFLRCAGPIKASRRESDAYRVGGTAEFAGFCNVTTFKLDAAKLVEIAHGYGVTVTTLLSAALLRSLILVQKREIENPKRQKPVKLLIPINLRPLFSSSTLRNFVLYTIPEADPRLGEWTLTELCRLVHHKLGMDATAKNMSRMIATNVDSERRLILRVTPLAVKNLVMKAIFNAVGERKSCLSFSNLGRIKLPPELSPYVSRVDFVLGPQATAPYNCGLVSYGDTAYLNFIRNVKEPRLEYAFHNVLMELGIVATVESNRTSRKN